RRAKPGDGAGIIRAHVRSIREVCAKDYTPEQVEAWAGRDFSVEHREASTLRDQVWGVEGPGGEIFGFGHSGGDAEKGFYLYGLYFCPEVRGMGFGKQIVGEILDVVRAEGAKKISLHATR